MKRQEFLEKLKAEHRMFGFKNLIYVDETGFDAHTHRPSGWAAKGCKIFGEVTGKRSRRTNLIMAQRHGAKGRKKEWLAPMLFQGSCNAQLFEMWVEECLMKELHEPTIVVMEGLPHLGTMLLFTIRNACRIFWLKGIIILSHCRRIHQISIPLKKLSGLSKNEGKVCH